MKANGGFCNEVSGAWMLLWLGCLFKAASLCVGFEQLVIISVTSPPAQFCNLSYGNVVHVCGGSSDVSNFLRTAVNIYGIVNCFSFEVRNGFHVLDDKSPYFSDGVDIVSHLAAQWGTK